MKIHVQDSASTAKSTESSIAKSTAPSSTASATDTGIATTAANGNYSQTNIRQSGVDEGDIAKTDGTYLYVREDNGRTIDIVDVRNGLKKYNEITLGEEYNIQEFYVNTEQRKLIVVCQKDCTDKNNKKQVNTDNWNQSNTAAVTYNIENIQKPVKEGEVTQSGTYHSSRMADGYLYLFSEYYTGSDMVKREPLTYVPLVNDKEMSQASYRLPPVNCGTMYEVISSVDISKPDETVDNKAVLSGEGRCMSAERTFIITNQNGSRRMAICSNP